MPPRNLASLLADIIDASDFMQVRATGMSQDMYLADEDLRVIFERKFEIIGEALGRVRKVALQVFDQIRHAAAAVDFRNVLIHGYGAIDHKVVWDTFSHWLPELIADVRNISKHTE